MSKLVKNLLIDDLKRRWGGVGELVVVSLGKLDAQKTMQLRQNLRKKKIHLQLIKNSLARLAAVDTPLAPAFVKTEGMLAVAWGGEDVVDLAKELERIAGHKDFEGFELRGGALDGSRLEAGDVQRVAKWPSRGEQLSILVGQINAVGGRLSGQIGSAGGVLAAQIKSRIEDLEKTAETGSA